jgi:hypothetical protein
MKKVKQLHRLMPDQVEKLLDFMANELKGEETFNLLDKSDQMDLISCLCDNPSEWWAKSYRIINENFDEEHLSSLMHGVDNNQ